MISCAKQIFPDGNNIGLEIVNSMWLINCISFLFDLTKVWVTRPMMSLDQ